MEYKIVQLFHYLFLSKTMSQKEINAASVGWFQKEFVEFEGNGEIYEIILDEKKHQLSVLDILQTEIKNMYSKEELQEMIDNKILLESQKEVALSA